jgi:hypothetical protein
LREWLIQRIEMALRAGALNRARSSGLSMRLVNVSYGSRQRDGPDHLSFGSIAEKVCAISVRQCIGCQDCAASRVPLS